MDYEETYGPEASTRWLTPDPAGLAAVDLTNPQSLNRYAYVLNNPTTLIDPWGLQGQGPCAGLQYGRGLGQCQNAANGVIASNGELGFGYGWNPFEFLSFWDCASGGDGNDCGYYDNLPASQFAASLQSVLSVLSGGVFDTPADLAPPPCGVSSYSLDNYLGTKNSPMVGQGANLMNSGQQYNLDPRLFVSLAGAETTFGTNITAGQYNAFNILYNGLNSPFSSFQSAINSAGHSLTNPRNGYDLTSTSTMYQTYCSTGSTCAAGLNNLNLFMGQQGANPSALHYPCNKD